MQQILKRLELIKTSIALEDEEIIELQIIKIKTLSYDSDVADILNSLDVNDFSMAVNAIEIYINKNTGLVAYEDKELQGLKLELKVLERNLYNLAERKNDCDTDIEDFNREYNLKLGDVIRRILGLRKELLYQQVMLKEQAFQASKSAYDKAKKSVVDAKQKAGEVEEELEAINEFSEEYDALYEAYQNLKEDLLQKEQDLNEKRKEAKQAKAELDDDPVNVEYEEAKEDSASFEEEYAVVVALETHDLDAEQEKELKLAYRKASRLCHPDIVSEELKDQAHTLMSELNAAKKAKNLERVKEILFALQHGGGFDVASDTIQDKDVLSAKISSIKKNIASLEIEIGELEKSDSFQVINEIEDKDEYFEELKAQLEEELERLAEELCYLQNKPEDFYFPGGNDSFDAPDERDVVAYEEMVAEDVKKNPEKYGDSYWTEEI